MVGMENVKYTTLILSHPVVLHCSRKITKHVSQTQLNLVSDTLYCYMFRLLQIHDQAVDI